MNQPVMTEFQTSLTEWFAALGNLAQSQAFLEEDRGKVERLEILHQTISLNYERRKSLGPKICLKNRLV
jgi:hypothetical protein